MVKIQPTPTIQPEGVFLLLNVCYNFYAMESIRKILQQKSDIKLPAYPWQELALKIIDDLKVPGLKKSSVFKACKNNSKEVIEKALNDTKELCKTGECWKYFFKLINKLEK